MHAWITETYSSWIVQLAVVFGLLVGSFLNVVIYRIPVMMEREWTVFAKTHLNIALTDEEKEPFSLTKPASRCPKCGSSVKPWQNIPVLSYILLKGQCHKCHVHISLRYPLIEILTACVFGIVAVCHGWSWITLTGFIFSAILIALTFIDADTQYLPDELTNPLINHNIGTPAIKNIKPAIKKINIEEEKPFSKYTKKANKDIITKGVIIETKG